MDVKTRLAKLVALKPCIIEFKDPMLAVVKLDVVLKFLIIIKEKLF